MTVTFHKRKKTMINNPEQLSTLDIIRKIRHLEHSVSLCLIRSGSALCKNRQKRIKVLYSYLHMNQENDDHKCQCCLFNRHETDSKNSLSFDNSQLKDAITLLRQYSRSLPKMPTYRLFETYLDKMEQQLNSKTTL